jgi:hypothetical protein
MTHCRTLSRPSQAKPVRGFWGTRCSVSRHDAGTNRAGWPEGRPSTSYKPDMAALACPRIHEPVRFRRLVQALVGCIAYAEGHKPREHPTTDERTSGASWSLTIRAIGLAAGPAEADEVTKVTLTRATDGQSFKEPLRCLHSCNNSRLESGDNKHPARSGLPGECRNDHDGSSVSVLRRRQ